MLCSCLQDSTSVVVCGMQHTPGPLRVETRPACYWTEAQVCGASPSPGVGTLELLPRGWSWLGPGAWPLCCAISRVWSHESQKQQQDFVWKPFQMSRAAARIEWMVQRHPVLAFARSPVHHSCLCSPVSLWPLSLAVCVCMRLSWSH